MSWSAGVLLARGSRGRLRNATAMPIGILLCLLSAVAAVAQPAFPALTGRVVDEAGILDPAAEARIGERLRALEAQSSDQLVVVTLRSLQGYDIADYGYQLGRHWGIGQRGTNNGVLLIVAPNERSVRIEVGYGLEATLTDALANVIVNQSILPRFRAGDLAGGIERGVEDIVKVLTGDAAEVAQRLRARPETQEPAVDLASIIVILIVVFIILNAFRHGGGGPRGRHGRRGRPRVIFLPGGGWSGRGGGSFGGGSGGFSGGGGSFGGGGSSGRW